MNKNHIAGSDCLDRRLIYNLCLIFLISFSGPLMFVVQDIDKANSLPMPINLSRFIFLTCEGAPVFLKCEWTAAALPKIKSA